MNFDKKFNIYDKNACVQKDVAKDLITFMSENISKRDFYSTFEIGCGTGIFTKEFLNTFSTKTLILNDIFDIQKYLKEISYTQFLLGDIEKLDIPNSEIIISSSVLQWINDFEQLIKKLATSCKYLTFSIYIENNLEEIYSHFGITLNYMSAEKIKQILEKYFTNIVFQTNTYKYNFSSPIEALRHLKNTGVTGFKTANTQSIRNFKSSTLTYHAAFFLAINKGS